LQQLITIRGSAGDELIEMYEEESKRRGRPTFDEWVKKLNAEARRHRKIYVVLDALDEAEEEALEEILEVLAAVPNCSRIMTSRPFVIERYTEIYNIPPDRKLEIQAQPEDLRTYIVGRLNESRRRVSHDPALQELVVGKVIDRAQGM